MKINLRYLAFSLLALAAGLAYLQPGRESAPSPAGSLESGKSKLRPRSAAQATRLHDHDRKSSRRGQGGDVAAALAALDQMALEIASGTASPDDVFTTFSDSSSAGTLQAAALIFAGKKMASFESFELLPQGFVAALTAALRDHSDPAGVALALDTVWRETEDLAGRQRLEDLDIPGLFAARVIESQAAGESEAVLKHLDRLEICDHPGTPEIMAGLASEPGIDLNELCGLALAWGERSSGLSNAEDLTARLTNPTLSPEQRIVLGYTLAGAAPGTETIAALEEAARAQTSAEWRDAFEAVRELAAAGPQRLVEVTE